MCYFFSMTKFIFQAANVKSESQNWFKIFFNLILKKRSHQRAFPGFVLFLAYFFENLRKNRKTVVALSRKFRFFQKNLIFPKISIFLQNFDFSPKSRFFAKIAISDHNFYFFLQNFDFSSKFLFFSKIFIFLQNFYFSPKFLFLIRISIFV